MSPLTPWHYFLLAVLVLIFLLGSVLAMRSRSKFSIITTIAVLLTLIGAFIWNSINQSVYKVEVSNLSDERFYQSEQILIKGTVRNVGNHPVANVKARIKLSNFQSGNKAKASQFAQPGAFAELFEDDSPEFKRQNVLEEHVIADHLNPGAAKTFRIMMDYPSHFKNAAYTIEAKAD